MYFFFFQAEDGIRDIGVTGVQTCALPIYLPKGARILNNTATRKSLSDRVQGMREKLQGITNKNYSNSMSIGGTSVVININGAQNPTNIAQEIKKVLKIGRAHV